MNILIQNESGSKFYIKPDITLWRKDSDFFIPDTFSNLCVQPAIATRITRAGKHISSAYSNRYYNSIGLAAILFEPRIYSSVLLISELTLLASIEQSFYYIDSVDLSLNKSSFRLVLSADETEVISPEIYDTASIIDNAIERVTKQIAVKNGDIVAVFLDSFVDVRKGTNFRMGVIEKDNNYSKLLDFFIK